MKPKNEGPNWCPLWKAKCSKVCHTCEFWAPMDLVQGNHTRTEYKCAFVWAAATEVMSHSRLDGIQRATEQVRNQFAEFRGSLVALIGNIAGVQRQIAAQPRDMGKVLEQKDATPNSGDPA
jgi:hypothetical protein